MGRNECRIHGNCVFKDKDSTQRGRGGSVPLCCFCLDDERLGGWPKPKFQAQQPASTAPFVHTCGLTSHITSERSRRQPISKKSQNPMCHEAICAVPSREHRKSGVPSHDHFSCMWLLIRARRAFPRQRTTRMLLSHNRNQSRSQVRAGSDAKAQIIQRGR